MSKYINNLIKFINITSESISLSARIDSISCSFNHIGRAMPSGIKVGHHPCKFTHIKFGTVSCSMCVFNKHKANDIVAIHIMESNNEQDNNSN